jgi:hypothetical protein
VHIRKIDQSLVAAASIWGDIYPQRLQFLAMGGLWSACNGRLQQGDVGWQRLLEKFATAVRALLTFAIRKRLSSMKRSPGRERRRQLPAGICG